MSSAYLENLDPPSKKRYKDKISLIDNVDPYAVNDEEFSTDIDNLPHITYPDIVNYLVFTSSPFSAEDMKAYKSLEAYNQVLEGWVRDIRVLPVSELFVIKGKV